MIDKLMVNGVPLENRARIIQDWDGARSIGQRRRTNVVVPNRDGEVWMPKSRDVKMFTVALTILPVDPISGVMPATPDARRRLFNANWRDFARLVGQSDKPLILGREMGFPDGVVEKHTAPAEIEGTVDPIMLTPDTASTAVTFKLLSGVWLGEASDTLGKQTPAKGGQTRASGVEEITITCPGDAVTYAIDVFLKDGMNQRLTNTDTGDWVQVAGATGNEVQLKIPEYQATDSTGENVISRITVGDTQFSPYWMTLKPGPNRLTLAGGGTARLVYRGAFL